MKRQLLLLAIISFGSTVSLLSAQGDEELRLLPPVNAVIAEEPAVEQLATPPPLALPFAEVYPTWLPSPTWFAGPEWHGSLELGLNGSEGNSPSISIRTGGKLKRKTENHTLSVDFSYAKTKSNSILTQHNALMGTQCDWDFSDSSWTLFSRTGLEYDEFKAFDLRLVLNGGVGYHFIKNDVATLTGRFGAGASHEIGGPDDSWVPEADFGVDYEHQLTDRQKLIAGVDYLPAWEDVADYRLVSTVSWEVLLDEASNLSLKVGGIDRYDSTPNGRRPNDIDYYLTLLWKL